ncbi:MAG: M20/M25/M40 family metallo-hydrolase, partial [Rhodospirillales bacterium]
DAGLALQRSEELHISFDCESGRALGAKWLLQENLVKPDMVIAGGPAQAVATHSTGTLILDVEVRGKTAPSHAPGHGHDALEAASHALARLYQFRGGLKGQVSTIPGLGSPSMLIERITGGADGGGVPDVVTFHIDRRLLPEEDPVQVEKQLTNLIGSTIAKLPGVRCRIRRTSLIPAMGNNDAGNIIRSVIDERLKAKTGTGAVQTGLSYDHEGRHYAASGIPTVMYGAGPLDPIAAGLHGPDENLVLDDVRLGTEILALSAIDLLSAR